MLSYQHGYHAGNFADVFKHFTLTRLLSYFLLKEKPFFYLETHAGRGLYDLHHTQAQKTGEYLQGIRLLWEKRKNLCPLFSPYLNLIKQVNKTEELSAYPGSPYIAIHMIRPQDRIYCCELHPREYDILKTLPHIGKRAFYSHSDGIASLNTLLPPQERRGLIFIDPSFEIKTEYKLIPRAINLAFRRFSTGVYCLWYPIIDNHLHAQLLRGMKAIAAEKALKLEFHLNKQHLPGMQSCGLIILNPPFVLAEEASIALQELSALFNPGGSSFIVESL